MTRFDRCTRCRHVREQARIAHGVCDSCARFRPCVTCGTPTNPAMLTGPKQYGSPGPHRHGLCPKCLPASKADAAGLAALARLAASK